MPKTKAILPDSAVIVWAFGKPYQFHWVTVHNLPNAAAAATNANLETVGPEDFGTGGSAGDHQKYQIMLHSTSGNAEGRSTLEWFQTGTDSTGAILQNGAHIVVERPRNMTASFGGAGVPVPPRASRAGIARLRADAVLDDGDRFVDIVRLANLSSWVHHGSMGGGNRNSIGIEHSNVETEWRDPNSHRLKAVDDTLDPATSRPRNLNRVIHLPRAQVAAVNWGGGDMDFQAFDDAQYNSMILMLRAICTQFRIPRQFFGDTWGEQAARYLTGFPGGVSGADRRERANRLRRFRGIIRHNHAHPNKTCPGIIAHNRLFRGIIDEWWLPVEINGAVRPYYSGPFWDPPFTAPNNGGQPTRPAWFRWMGGNPPRVESTVYREANIDALTEAKSYFDLDQTSAYFTACETLQGGTYPIGENRVWHGGVHLEPQAANPVVYAAASGTIVAARLSSHPDTDAASGFGSQRFILIRHAVSWQTQNDTAGPPSLGPGDPAPQRLDYGTDPTYVFSLYMHLDPIPDLFSEHADNPRWYNRWLVDQAAAGTAINQATLDPIVGMTAPAGKGRVFNPNVEVSVGDVLGVAGLFARLDDPTGRRRMVHFEILSHRDHEITAVGARRAEDNDQNAICDVQMINQELGGQSTAAAARAAAPRLRDVRVRHRSTWSWDNPGLFAGIVNAFTLPALFLHVTRMSWLADAIAANADLRTQLGATGFFWHYHPIAFMSAINKLILSENRELVESPHLNVVTNIELNDDGFLTDFVRFNAVAPHWRLVAADGAVIKPYDVDPGRHGATAPFSLTRADLACRSSAAAPPTNHNPPHNPPQQTKFHIALVDIFERIRVRFNRPLTVSCAFICPAHTGELTRCTRRDAAHILQHAGGVAIDFHPQRTAANIRDLWREVTSVCNRYNTEAAAHAGTACHGNLPEGFNGVEFKAQTDAVTAKLNAGTALTVAEVASFDVHIALTP